MIEATNQANRTQLMVGLDKNSKLILQLIPAIKCINPEKLEQARTISMSSGWSNNRIQANKPVDS